MSDVIVIGSGLVGLAIARELCDRGLDVGVLSNADRVPASLAAAGMLAPLTETEPGSAFQWACLAARDLWPDWGRLLHQATGVDLGFCHQPTLVPAFTTREYDALDTLRRRAEAVGDGAQRIGPSDVYATCPDLAAGAIGGLLLKGEKQVDPTRVVEALVADLEQKDVLIHHDRAVAKIEVRPNHVALSGRDWSLECERVVVAAGAWSGQPDFLGLEGFVIPVRGQMIAYRSDHKWQGAIRHHHFYALVRGDEVLVGATEEKAGFADHTTEAGAEFLRDAAEALLPHLRWRRILRHWSGLRPGSFDGLPIVGPLGSERVVVASGTHRNGILLAPWLARQVAELITTGEAPDLPRELLAARLGRR